MKTLFNVAGVILIIALADMVLAPVAIGQQARTESNSVLLPRPEVKVGDTFTLHLSPHRRLER